ncbi:MAG: hypothetical protein VXW13_06315 [SAR324 cluster bacterium]|nr:hypothetical protein [SAR324 cluster bacterium]
MTIEVLDPTHEGDSREFKIASGLKDLKGSRIGLISNGKRGTLPFFNAIEELLKSKYEVREVIRVVKKNYSAPAEEEIMTEVKKWDAVIAGVGD